MDNFGYFSKTFDILKTNTYKLSLGLKPGSITYTIVDTVRNKCVAIKHNCFAQTDDISEYYKYIKTFLDEDTFLSKHYKSINFVFSSPKSTLIPYEHFHKSTLKKVFTINHELHKREELHFNKLLDLHLVNVFSIPSAITTLMVNKFPEMRFYHQSSTLIDRFVRQSVNRKSIIGVCFCEQYLHFVVAKQGKLELYNHVEYSKDEDVVYHVMNIYKQLNLNNRETNLYLSGMIMKNSSTYRLLSEYVSNIWFSKALSSDRKMIYNFKEIPEHTVANLLSIK